MISGPLTHERSSHFITSFPWGSQAWCFQGTGSSINTCECHPITTTEIDFCSKVPTSASGLGRENGAFGVLCSPVRILSHLGQGMSDKVGDGHGPPFDRMPSVSDWSQAAFYRLPVMPFISRVCS